MSLLSSNRPLQNDNNIPHMERPSRRLARTLSDRPLEYKIYKFNSTQTSPIKTKNNTVKSHDPPFSLTINSISNINIKSPPNSIMSSHTLPPILPTNRKKKTI